ncbi:MAG: N-acylglucosamine 2-epimerase [Proteiniphilum sp. 51_7]|nr:MAG: N-acylglucosamine 2-epimerase [Proteiniphilum sp. 51_7]
MDTNVLKKELHNELTGNILPFWMNRMKDNERGGYYGRITGENRLVPDATKGGILHARILWTFSSAALRLQSEKYLAEAQRVKAYIFSHFFDDRYGGTYWMLHADGTPADPKKQIYSQAFFIYALTEFYRASGDQEARDKAKELFRLIEQHSFDNVKNGYLEAYSRDWVLLEDLRLSEKDANEKKTMNTHLHILEAYTNLYRVWKDITLARQLKNLIGIFLEKIIDPVSGHLNLFFDEEWHCKSTIYSFGHDIEASWLLEEAARVLGDEATLRKVQSVTLRIANAAAEGLNDHGGLINERDWASGHRDERCDWWPQAEAVVGFFNAWQLSGKSDYLDKACNSWEFIKLHLIDREVGEWFWSVSPDGEKDRVNDKAGFWKCPYHNGRMCLELIERIKQSLPENTMGKRK